jgi:hypothetical protein
MWFAFKQHYALHEVENGRFNLDPYLDYNIVIEKDFPSSVSLRGAISINPMAFYWHILRNIYMLPRAFIVSMTPFTSANIIYLPFVVFFGFFAIAIIYALIRDWQNLFLGLYYLILKQKKYLYLTFISMLGLIPTIFVYPTPRYTLILVPFYLLWFGFILAYVLTSVNFLGFIHYGLIALVCLFIICILVVQKPYTFGGERKIYKQVKQLLEVWPKSRVKLMGVGSSTYASYIGSRNVLPIEPLPTVYGWNIDNKRVDLLELIKRYDPDAVFINGLLMGSKNFNAISVDVLHTDQWVKYSVGDDTVYFLKERLASILEVPMMYTSGRIESWRDAMEKGYLIGGWHEAAPEGIWSSGYGILQFRLSPEQRSRYHAVSLQLLVPIGGQDVQYRIQSGRHIAAGTFLGSSMARVEMFKLQVPLADVSDGIDRIVLSTHNAVRPVDIGLNADTRMLGLGIVGMRLIP